MEKIECDIHEGNKVGASAVGELNRSKDKVKLHANSLFVLCNTDAETMLIYLQLMLGNT